MCYAHYFLYRKRNAGVAVKIFLCLQYTYRIMAYWLKIKYILVLTMDIKSRWGRLKVRGSLLWGLTGLSLPLDLDCLKHA